MNFILLLVYVSEKVSRIFNLLLVHEVNLMVFICLFILFFLFGASQFHLVTD